jgi:hypothetical protein
MPNQGINGNGQGEESHCKGSCEAKKLVKLVATTKLSLTKGLPKTPKGEKEEPLPCNPEIEKGRASTRKESSKNGASKDTV